MSKSPGKKNRALPTDPAEWDWKTCLRFAVRAERLLSVVPHAARATVYPMVEQSMAALAATKAPEGALFVADPRQEAMFESEDVAGALE